MHIVSERLILRPWVDTDKQPFADMSADSVVMEYLMPLTAEDASGKWIDHQLERLNQPTRKTGRTVGSYVLTMVIADETDDAAWAKWNHYRAGADTTALAWMASQAAADSKADPNFASST